MKDRLLLLLAALLTLARTPPDSKTIKSQRKKITDLRDEIKTFHGDEDLASIESEEPIDDLIEVLALSEPPSDIAEEPDDDDEEDEKDKTAPPKPAPSKAKPVKPLK